MIGYQNSVFSIAMYLITWRRKCQMHSDSSLLTQILGHDVDFSTMYRGLSQVYIFREHIFCFFLIAYSNLLHFLPCTTGLS